MLDHREEKFHERLGRCYIEIEKFSKQYEGKFKAIDRRLDNEVSIRLSRLSTTFFFLLKFLHFIIEREKRCRVQNERCQAL